MTTKSKIALVTGGSRGLGKDMALNLGKKGNNVIITYHSKKDEALAVAAEIEKMKSVKRRLDPNGLLGPGTLFEL